MANPLPPALAAEEWTNRRYERVHTAEGGYVEVRKNRLEIPTGEGWSVSIEGEELAKIAAFALEALPDDSPYKITRQWVDELREVAEFISSNHTPWDAKELVRIADALEALLPPESEPRTS